MPGVSGTPGPVGGDWHGHAPVRSPHSPTPQVMDRTWLALARASQTPASSPPPMGAPQCLAQGGPLPAEVALDAGRTTTCKGSTPTDASRPEPRERTAGQRDPGYETCDLVTITNLAEKKIEIQPWGEGRARGFWRRLWVSGLKFLNIFLSLTHQHNKKKSHWFNNRVKKICLQL